ncbi:hypothetical protein JCM11251_005355 [Rhodosporidiobolus azoricus]
MSRRQQHRDARGFAPEGGIPKWNGVKRRLQQVQAHLAGVIGIDEARDWMVAISWPLEEEWNTLSDDAKKRAAANALNCVHNAKSPGGVVMSPEQFLYGVRHSQLVAEDAVPEPQHYGHSAPEASTATSQTASRHLHTPYYPSKPHSPSNPSLTATAGPDLSQHAFSDFPDNQEQYSLAKRTVPHIALSYGAARAHGIDRERWMRRMNAQL